MPFDIGNIEIPEFGKHLRKPRAAECKTIDSKRIIAEILGGNKDARDEQKESQFAHSNLLDGSYAIVLRYKREKDELTYPAVSMSYDIDEQGNVIIKQIQRAQNKTVSFRFHSSFDANAYFLSLIRENFTNKGVKVFMSRAGMDGVGFRSTAVSDRDFMIGELEKLNAEIED